MPTFSTAVDVHAREPIVPDETSFGAVCDVPLLAVEVSLREAEIDHVYRLVFWLEANDEIAKLHVPVQHASRVHELQPRNLRACQKVWVYQRQSTRMKDQKERRRKGEGRTNEGDGCRTS